MFWYQRYYPNTLRDLPCFYTFSHLLNSCIIYFIPVYPCLLVISVEYIFRFKQSWYLLTFKLILLKCLHLAWKVIFLLILELFFYIFEQTLPSFTYLLTSYLCRLCLLLHTFSLVRIFYIPQQFKMPRDITSKKCISNVKKLYS